MWDQDGPVVIVSSFAPRCREHAQQLKDTISAARFPCELGEDFGGVRISEGVRRTIRRSSFVIGLLERPNRKSWEPSSFVVRELELASSLKKKCIPVVEQGVSFSRELIADLECIYFRANNFSSVFPRILRELNNRNQNQEPWFYIPPEDIEDSCSGNARAHLEQTRTLGKQAEHIIEIEPDEKSVAGTHLKLALKHAREAVALAPHSWQARLALGGILLASELLDESHRVNASILEDFNNDSRACAAAHHNLGVELERRFPHPRSKKINKEIVRHYESSLRADPLRAATRAPLVCFYLRLFRFNEAYALLEQSIGVPGFQEMMVKELQRSPDRITLLTLLSWAQNLFFPMTLPTTDNTRGDWRHEQPSIF